MLTSVGDDTPLGTFQTPEKYRWRFMVNDTYTRSATRIKAGAGFLFHSITYETTDPNPMITAGYNGLGVVRFRGLHPVNLRKRKMDCHDNCKLGTTVVIYEDPNTPVPVYETLRGPDSRQIRRTIRRIPIFKHKAWRFLFHGKQHRLRNFTGISPARPRGRAIFGRREHSGRPICRKEEKRVAQFSPMMTQYLETKKQYPDCILFYRLGDFYEMFFEDAKTASRELELTLTGKDCGLEERAPMCGVPYHAVESYLTRLVQKGYKVAIAEQMEDPKQAKGLVRREVIRVVTPGTITSAQALDETKNNYLMAVVYTGNNYGAATVDSTTGDFFVTEVNSERALLDEINKFAPSELICNEALEMSGLDMEELKERYHLVVTALDNRFFSDDTCRQVSKRAFQGAESGGAGTF